MNRPALLIVILGLASSALGCLGDGEPELRQRYGPQTKTGTSHLPGVTVQGYNFGNFLVVVGVLNGRSTFETYSKKDGSKISASDVNALMNANSGGRTWVVDKTSTEETAKWVTDDGAVFTEWDKASGTTLTVMTKEASDLERSTRSKKK